MTGAPRRLAGVSALLVVLATLAALVAAPAEGFAGSDDPAPVAAVDPALAHRAVALDALETPFALPTDRPPRFLLAGDSVADTLANALATEATRRGATMGRSIRPGCGLLPGLPTTLDGFTPPWAAACSGAAPDWRNQIARASTDVVLLLSTWDGSPRLLDGTFVDPATPEGRATFVELMHDLVEVVAPSGSGRSVVLMAEAIPTRGARTGEPSATRVAESRSHRAVLRAVAQGDPGRVRVVDLGRWLCPTGAPCPELLDGVHARPDDGSHLSPDGAAWLAPRILDALGLSPG